MIVDQVGFALQRRTDFISVPIVAAHFAFVLAPIYVAAYLGGIGPLIVCYLWFGLMQNSVANLMHETAHRLTFRKYGWNDALGYWILGPLFLTSFDLYRRRHWVHHTHTGDEDDTKTTYLIRFGGLAAFLAFALRCFVGIEAVKRFANTQAENRFVKPLTADQKRQTFIQLLVFHAVLASSLLGVAYLGTGEMWPAILQAGLAYGVVYLYGAASLLILLSTLRAIVEHQVVDGDTSVLGKAALRNMRPTPSTRLLFGSHGFCEHATHHEYPAIPHYNLPKATAVLTSKDDRFAYGQSYWGLLRHLIGAAPKAR